MALKAGLPAAGQRPLTHQQQVLMVQQAQQQQQRMQLAQQQQTAAKAASAAKPQPAIAPQTKSLLTAKAGAGSKPKAVSTHPQAMGAAKEKRKYDSLK